MGTCYRVSFDNLEAENLELPLLPYKYWTIVTEADSTSVYLNSYSNALPFEDDVPLATFEQEEGYIQVFKLLNIFGRSGYRLAQVVQINQFHCQKNLSHLDILHGEKYRTSYGQYAYIFEKQNG